MYLQFKKAISEKVNLPEKSWHVIEQNCSILSLNKNEYFSKEGDSTKNFGVILQGVLRVFYLQENGNEWNKHFLAETNFVAASITPNTPALTNIQALTAVKILIVPYTILLELSKEYNEIAEFIQTLTFQYLEQKQKREIELLSQDTRRTYTNFLENSPSIHNRIPQYHIASYLGITPTQLSRLRKQL